jgi:uncharacterized membrane protein
MNRMPMLTLAVVLAACVVVIAATLPELPAVMASHFGLTGSANGWAPRSIYGAVILGFGIALPCCIVLATALPGIAPRTAARLLKLPHPDYWLAPERREQTLSSLRGYGCGFAIATMLFVTALHLLTVDANLHPPPRLAPAPLSVLLGLYGSALAVLAIFRRRRFRPAR